MATQDHGTAQRQAHRPHGPMAPRLLCASLALFIGAAQAQILQNGSFESPTIADGTLQITTPSSWTGGAALMNPNAAGGFSNGNFTWPQAADGQQYEDIGNTASYALSQTFTLASAGGYTLSWLDNTALSIAPGFQTAPYSVSITNGSFQQVLAGNYDSYHADGVWQARSLTQVFSAGSYTLTFTSLNSPNTTDTLIDAVSITAVPEPASALLVMAGLAALGLQRRHARNAEA